MSATNVYSSLFASATSRVPATGYPLNNPFGAHVVSVIYAIATTSIDEATDFIGLIPLPAGKKWQKIVFTCPDLDTGSAALDLDIITRTTDKDGVNTDTILFNAGTAFTAAQTEVAIYPTASGGDQLPSIGDTPVVILGLLCNVAATTAATGTIKLTVYYQ